MRLLYASAYCLLPCRRPYTSRYAAGTIKIVKSTDEVRPPIMARAMGVYCSAPVPNFIAMGVMPMIVASEVIRMGRSRTRHAVITASAGAEALRLQVMREIHNQDAVGIGDADEHQHSH